MRLLLSAYACEPDKGSEPGVGWNWAIQAARFHEVWVITRTSNRAAIEAELARRAQPNLHWRYLDLPPWARWWKRGRRGLHLYYYLWQIGAYLLARRLHARIRFDAAQHVTFANYWMPSLIGLLPIRFVWGPVGGGEPGPRALYGTLPLQSRIYEHLRDIVRGVARADPVLRAVARRADVALATTPESADALRRLGANNVHVVSQVALLPEDQLRLLELPLREEDPFRFVSVGALLHLKGLHLGLEAFARVQRTHGPCEYWLVGDGPERRRLHELARSHGVEGEVKFLGQLPRSQVPGALASCDVLLFLGLHDSGGYACVEAMAAGRPVICLDLGGPSLLVTEDAGIRVAAATADRVVSDLVSAMVRLRRDRDLKERLAAGGRRRVREAFDWDSRGEQVYSLLIGKSELHAERNKARAAR